QTLPYVYFSVLLHKNILTISSFSAVRHIRGHTFSEGMASAFVLPNLPVLQTLWPVSHNACRSVDGMVSGNMVPSFPSFVIKLKLFYFNFLFFTLPSVYN